MQSIVLDKVLLRGLTLILLVYGERFGSDIQSNFLPCIERNNNTDNISLAVAAQTVSLTVTEQMNVTYY